MTSKKLKPWSRFHFAVLSLLFILVNYSEHSWSFFNSLGGETLAKVAPEILGLVFFLVLSKIYILKVYPKVKIRITRTDLFAIILLSVLSFIARFKQFSTYFFKDDFHLFLNHDGLGYSIYKWGPWLSSHPAWIWEVIRYFFGYSIFPYQLGVVLSHLFLIIGIYFLVKYLTKDFWTGLITAILALTTTITFEAFQWLTHPISFGWQGLLVCLSLIALFWEINKNQGKKTPYLSAFLMMAAFGAGLARVGVMLPIITAADLLFSLKWFNFKRAKAWVVYFFGRQWIFYLMVSGFFIARQLWKVTGTRPETVTAPLYKIFLFLFGVFTYPPEFIDWASRSAHLYPGKTSISLSFMFFIFIFILFLIRKIFKKSFPLAISFGLSWVSLSAFYFTLFGPHVPVTEATINLAMGSHHLSYLASVGSLIIWGFLISKGSKYFIKITARILPYWFSLILATLPILVILGYSLFSLSSAYEKFLDRPEGIKVPVTRFFFDTYRKYVPLDVRSLIVFYDDGYMKRKDNFKPFENYFEAFWQIQPVDVIVGDNELSAYLFKIEDPTKRKEELGNLHYIFTDYYSGIGEDMSDILRAELVNPSVLQIAPTDWQVMWGSRRSNIFIPEIVSDTKAKTNYFKPPVLKSPLLKFPAILTPNLTLTLRIYSAVQDSSVRYSDIRADVLGKYINSNGLLDDSGLGIAAEARMKNSSKVSEDFNKLISSTHISDKLVCDEKVNDNGIMLLVSWVGAPDSYFQTFSEDEKNNFFSTKYLDRFYVLCNISYPYSVQSLSINLENLGSFVRGIVVIPLTKIPVSLEIIEASLIIPSLTDIKINGR